MYYYNTDTGIPDNSALGKDETEDTNWKPVSGNNDNRIAKAPVRFIGNHYADDDGNLHKSTSKHSVFGGTDEGAPVSNIVNLTF